MKRRFLLPTLIALALCLMTSAVQGARHAESFRVQEGVGIAGITVGKSTDADVIAAFGRGFELIEHGEYSKEMRYAELGLMFRYCARDRKRRIFDIEVRSPASATTEKGVILGDTLMREIIKLYGKPKWRTTEDGKTWWLEYKGVEFHVPKETTVNQFPLDEALYLDRPVIAIHVVKLRPRNCPEPERDDENR